MSSARGNKKVPAIRFAGFGGEWQDDFLGSNAGFAKGQGYSKSDLVESGIPIILYGRLYTKYQTVISDIDTFVKVKENSLFSRGCEVIVPASGETPEDIAIASAVLEKDVVLGGDLNIIYPNHNIKAIFLALSLSNGNPKKEITKRAQGKSVVHVRNSDLSDINIHFPKEKEQTKIGNYFKQLDTLIAQHQQKHDKLQNIKKALLEKCFPKQGEHTPELRFKGFSGAWEEKALGECFDERVERSAEGQLISITINSGIKLFSELGRHDNSSDDKSKYKRVEIGDIAYNSMRMWQGSSGYSPYEGILSPAYTVIKSKKNISSMFFSYLIKKPEMILTFQNRSQGITSDTWNLKFPAFSKIFIHHPPKDEQTKIGNLFQQLDTLINQQQTQLGKLKNIKQACLEKMFV